MRSPSRQRGDRPSPSAPTSHALPAQGTADRRPPPHAGWRAPSHAHSRRASAHGHAALGSPALCGRAVPSARSQRAVAPVPHRSGTAPCARQAPTTPDAVVSSPSSRRSLLSLHYHFSTYCYQYESIILGTKKKSKRKSQKNSCKKPFDFLQLFASSSFSRLGHRFSVIVTALHAHVMRELRLMTLRARYIVRCFELPVRAATVATRFRGLSLWYCHFGYTSLIVFE